MDAAARSLESVVSASSEFLQLDEMDFSIIGKKVETFIKPTKKRSLSNLGIVGAHPQTGSKIQIHPNTENKSAAGEMPLRPTSASKTSTSMTSKMKKNDDSLRELTAMEIWSRNAKKNFGKTLAKNGYQKSNTNTTTQVKDKKSSSTSRNKSNNANNNNIQEMTVGAGAGPIIALNNNNNKKLSVSGPIKESSNLTIPTIMAMKKKKKTNKKQSKSISIIENKQLLINDNNSDSLLALDSDSSSRFNLTERKESSSIGGGGKAKNKKHSREMTVQEVEEIIGIAILPPVKKKSTEKIRKKKAKTIRKLTNITKAIANNAVVLSGDDHHPVSHPTNNGDGGKSLKVKNKAVRVEKVLSLKNESLETERSGKVKLEKELVDEDEGVVQAQKFRIQKFQAPPTKAVPPLLSASKMMEMSQYLTRVQTYFDQLGYHRVGEPQTIVNTKLSIKHLMTTSKVLIKLGQPIKCLHALILGIHFTNQNPLIERFPIHFKSKVNGKEYKHVVLGVYVQGHFGALGISRDPGLQDKPTIYPRLSELINSYYQCYNQSGHVLKELKLGQIITHDALSLQHISWKMGKVSFDMEPTKIEVEIEKISRKLKAQMGLICLRGMRIDQGNTGPPPQNNQPSKVAPGTTDESSMENRSLPSQTQNMRSRSIPARKIQNKMNQNWPAFEEALNKITSSTKTRTRPHKTKN